MATSTDLIKRFYQIKSDSKLRRLIAQIDGLSELAAEELGADFVALFYRKQDSNQFIPVSYSLHKDHQIKSLNLLELHWASEGTVDSKAPGKAGIISPLGESDLPQERFASDNDFTHHFNLSHQVDGEDRGVITAFWSEKPEADITAPKGGTSLLASMLVELMITIEELNTVDNYSMRLSELINLLEMPLGDYKFKDFVTEMVKRATPIVPVEGICLYSREPVSGRFRLQEILSDEKAAPSFVKGISNAVRNHFGEIVAREDDTIRWHDLSKDIKPEQGSVVAVEFSPEIHFQFVMVVWKSGSGSFTTNDLELLSVFRLFARAMLKNAILVRNTRKAQRILEKTSMRMAAMETTAALADMTSGVAHEFNNIVGGVVGRLQLLKVKNEDESLNKELEKIESLLMDGARTVKRIQEYTTKVKYKTVKTVSIGNVIKTVLDLHQNKWRESADAKKITVTFSTSNDDTIIEGNVDDLETAINNLLENAVDYSPEGAVISISLADDDRFVKVLVADNGPGVLYKNRRKVFYPFFTTKISRMAGLGLSVVHAIVSRHGGKVTVHDNKPSGAVFEMAFLKLGHFAEETDISRIRERQEKLRILVVDDDREIREVLRDMLTIDGHFLTTCSDGFEALKSLSEGEYDLMITDLGMPGMSGLELAKSAHDDNPSLDIAMITGWGTQLSQEEISSSGIKSLLAKPFHINDIQALVRVVV